MSPLVTASKAAPAMDEPGWYLLSGLGLDIATNHWSVNIGSMMVWVRSPRGTINLCG